MTYLTAEARQQLLDDMALAIEELALALAVLGAAYELLDEQTADRLEEELFRGVQTAFGRAQRTHAAFAARYSLQGRTFEQPSAGLPSQGARAFLERAGEAITEADTCSPSSRTRCCRSRSATPSCAPGWPRSARSWASCRAARISSCAGSGAERRPKTHRYACVLPADTPSTRPCRT